MAALFIVNITEIRDPDRFKLYQAMTPPTIEKYGGRYRVRGGDVSVMEGDWTPNRLVVLEFPSMERLKAWHSSEIYAEALALRTEIADTNAIAVETLD
ncbi:MAG: DUF1330 domain-containing protein [Alphaproteobacteria bacterium]|nr:DUF1330 domain-containing protein [Alphaproteobacteria bacterium]